MPLRRLADRRRRGARRRLRRRLHRTPARSSSSTSARLAAASSAIASLPAGMSGSSVSTRSMGCSSSSCLLGAEEEDLGVEVLEHELEIVLVTHLDHALETERHRLLRELQELLGLVVRGDHDGIGSGVSRRAERRPVRKQRQRTRRSGRHRRALAGPARRRRRRRRRVRARSRPPRRGSRSRHPRRSPG